MYEHLPVADGREIVSVRVVLIPQVTELLIGWGNVGVLRENPGCAWCGV